MHNAIAQGPSKPLVSYFPLARALLTLDSREKAGLMKNFDICYVLAC